MDNYHNRLTIGTAINVGGAGSAPDSVSLDVM